MQNGKVIKVILRIIYGGGGGINQSQIFDPSRQKQCRGETARRF